MKKIYNLFVLIMLTNLAYSQVQTNSEILSDLEVQFSKKLSSSIEISDELKYSYANRWLNLGSNVVGINEVNIAVKSKTNKNNRVEYQLSLECIEDRPCVIGVGTAIKSTGFIVTFGEREDAVKTIDLLISLRKSDG